MLCVLLKEILQEEVEGWIFPQFLHLDWRKLIEKPMQVIDLLMQGLFASPFHPIYQENRPKTEDELFLGEEFHAIPLTGFIEGLDDALGKHLFHITSY